MARFTERRRGTVVPPSGGMTYPQFVASITAKATNGSVGRNNNPVGLLGGSAAKVRVTMGPLRALCKARRGTTRTDLLTLSIFGRIAQHAFDNVTAFE
jgi:hypothetical protein